MRVQSIDRSNSYNNKQSFGTSTKFVNNLKPLLSQHKDVAPIINGIENGMWKLEQNGKLDALESELILKDTNFGKMITLVSKLFKATEKGFIKREKVKEDQLELFRYSPETQSVDIRDRLVTNAKIAEINKNGKLPEFLNAETDLKMAKDNANDIMPVYYEKSLNKWIGDSLSGNKIIIKGLDPLWMKHNQVGSAFEELNGAINMIGEKGDSGLVKFEFIERMHKKQPKLKQLNLKMSLYSATLEDKLNRVQKYGEFPLIVFDDNYKIVQSADNNLLSANKKENGVNDMIMNQYHNLKDDLDVAIKAVKEKEKSGF